MTVWAKWARVVPTGVVSTLWHWWTETLSLETCRSTERGGTTKKSEFIIQIQSLRNRHRPSFEATCSQWHCSHANVGWKDWQRSIFQTWGVLSSIYKLSSPTWLWTLKKPHMTFQSRRITGFKMTQGSKIPLSTQILFTTHVVEIFLPACNHVETYRQNYSLVFTAHNLYVLLCKLLNP